MSWEAFRKAVLSARGDTWDDMRNGDLVVGGMDFAMDFMYLSLVSSVKA